jgi:hypothetical protein
MEVLTMRFPNKETVEWVRKQYPVGCRVELTHMDDVQAPPVGTKGTVLGVDDTASVMVRWDNGSGLNVVYGEDSCRKLDSVKTVCYGKEELWDSRKEAADFFLRAVAGSEGAECERYTTIYAKLVQGLEVCSDDADD